MNKHSLKALNEKRKGSYYKDPEEEGFLETLNSYLQPKELASYDDIPPSHPHIFIFGLPRSGTTLLSQLVAHGLDVGFIDNFMARFWLAPVHGIKLSRTILKKQPEPSFTSTYGATDSLKDIHEFGYFWRFWLLKDSLEGVKEAKGLDTQIRWDTLIQSLANIQTQFDKPMVYKNIFGTYHMDALSKALNYQTLWIYIHRDPLDVCISILNARKNFYENPNTWWSYAPPNYEDLINLEFWDQIVGQVHYLSEHYDIQLGQIKGKSPVLHVEYEKMVKDPMGVLKQIQDTIKQQYSVSINQKSDSIKPFRLKTYGNSKEKEIFSAKLSKLKSKS